MTAPVVPGVWRWRLAGREVLYAVTGEGVELTFRPLATAVPPPAAGIWEPVGTSGDAWAEEALHLRARLGVAEQRAQRAETRLALAEAELTALRAARS